MFELKVEVGQMCCRAAAAFADKDTTQEALAVGVNSTHFLLTSGNFLLFLVR